MSAERRVRDLKALEATLPGLGFHCETPRTFERNILFDTPDHRLRASTQILRVRRYGDRWVLTHKQTTPNDSPEARHPEPRHKERIETETAVPCESALERAGGALPKERLPASLAFIKVSRNRRFYS